MSAITYDIVTFDCYGTLIDWETGMRDAFAGAGLDPDAALQAYGSIERAVENDAYRRYCDVLTITAEQVAHRLGSPIADGSFLPASLPSWRPFPDTNRALERLRNAGMRLGILSNTDDDLLARTREHFTVDFDVVITAQQVQSYKPAKGHFEAARKRIGDARWLHAAQSNFHDIIPANALGIDTAWINRHREQPLVGGRPKHEFVNLTQLADALASR